MKRVILLVALIAVHGIQCRSISLPLTSSDEQSEHFGNVLKREKKSTPENPSVYEQQISAQNPLVPSLIEKHRSLPAAPVYSGAVLPVPGSIYPAPNYPHAGQQHHHHNHHHHHAHHPYGINGQPDAIPSLYPAHPKPLPLPVFPKPGEVIKKFRSMFDEDDDVEVIDENGTQPPSSFGGELQPSPRTYYPPVPSQYPLPQYLPQQYPQYVPRYEQPPKHEAPPKYEPTPKYEPKPIYENPAAAVPKYVPQYRPPQYSSAPCGSNLLIGCQPRVQAVPCYPPSSYSAPPAHSQSYKPPNPTGYPPVPLVKPAAAVYLQPGPPYPEPVTLSASNARNQVQTENTENTSPIEQRQDSEPESSNIERKTNESDHEAEDLVGTANVYPKTDATTEPPTTTTTMTTTTTTTTAPAPATTTTLKPSTEEQIRRLHEKLDNHLEDIKRLKEDSGKRLRAAIERSNSRSAVDEFEDMANIFDESAPFAKRHSLNRDLADNTVW